MSYLLDEGGSISREAEYVCSFEVIGDSQEECVEMLKQRLVQTTQLNFPSEKRKRVLLEISLSGIKVCFDSFGENVYMTHELKRISYSSCHPEFCQFSFLARNPKAPAKVQFCYLFLTDTPQEASELNSIVSEVFNTAYLHNACRPGTEILSPITFQQLPQAIVPLSASEGSISDVEYSLRVTNCKGLGSISSITESVNSWSFGISSVPQEASVETRKRFADRERVFCAPRERCATENEKPVNVSSSAVVSSTELHGTSLVRPLGEASTQKPAKGSSFYRSLLDLVSSHSPVAGTRSTGGPRSRSRTRPLSSRLKNDECETKTQPPENPVSPDVKTDKQENNRVINSANSSTSDRLCTWRLKEGTDLTNSSFDVELCSASWYKPGLSRESTLELLSRQEIGSFVVRDSITHDGCYALSVKVPKYDNPAGISHYLISRTPENMFRIKGLRKEWSCVTALVTHHTVMRELLPCVLRLPQQQTDGLMSESKLSDKENVVEQS